METTVQKRPFGFYVCSIAFSLERFSFYSAKWLMTIFVALSIAEGGLGLTSGDAAKMSANLVAFTYLLPLIGSYISDYLVGARYLVPIGLVLMGAGYLVGWQADSALMINVMIILVSIGTGLFKSQTNAITGRLFEDEGQLDGAFSIQYSFVNFGSFVGTTLIGLLALRYGHQFCFLICGIVVLIGAIWFVFGWRYLGQAGKRPFKVDETKVVVEKKEEEETKPLTVLEKKRIAAIIMISAFSIIFWVERYAPGRALRNAVGYTWGMTKLMLKGVWDWVAQRQEVDVTGPIGIASMSGRALREGPWSFVTFLALISLNLGLLNLFPIPALDGGRIVFVLLEMVFRRRLPERVENWIHMTGFALLIALMIFITWQDVYNLFWAR